MSDEIIDIIEDVCYICDRMKLCVVLDYDRDLTVCLHCLKELFDAWDYNDCEKFEFIGTEEYRKNFKKECD